MEALRCVSSCGQPTPWQSRTPQGKANHHPPHQHGRTWNSDAVSLGLKSLVLLLYKGVETKIQLSHFQPKCSNTDPTLSIVLYPCQMQGACFEWGMHCKKKLYMEPKELLRRDAMQTSRGLAMLHSPRDMLGFGKSFWQHFKQSFQPHFLWTTTQVNLFMD